MKLLPDEWKAINPLDFEVTGLEPHELVRLDYSYIQQCQAVIARVNNATWGTAMEIAYAKRLDIPVLAWSSQKIESPWLLAHVTKHFLTLREACAELQHVN